MKLKRVQGFALFTIGVSLLGFNSCKIDKDLGEGASISPRYQLPLTYGQLKVTDVLTDSSGVLVTDQSDQSLKVVSVSDSFTYFIGDRARIQSTIASRDMVIAANSVGNQNLDIDATAIAFPNQLREGQIITSNLDIQVTNNLQFPLQNIKVTLPGVTSAGGTPVSVTIANIAVNTTETRTIDVSNYHIDFGKNNTTINTIVAAIESDPSVNTGPFIATDRASVQVRFVTPVMKKIVGTFFSIDEIAVNAGATVLDRRQYDNIKSGSVKVDKAKITLRLFNTAGFQYYTRLDLATVNGVDTSIIVHLVKNGVDTPEYIMAPALEQGGEPVNQEALNTHVIADGQGYNLGEFLSNFPTRIKINAFFKDSIANPGAFNSVMYNTSAIGGYVETEVPLSIQFHNLVLEDTLDFDVLSQFGDQLNDTANIQLDTGNFYFRLKNSFPYDFVIDVDAFNSQDDSIAQITDVNGIQLSAGSVTNPTTAPLSIIPISNELFDKLKDAKKIRIRAKINNDDPTVDYQLYSTQFIDFKVFGDLKIRAKFN